MLGARIRLDGQSWRRVYRITGMMTALAIALSVIITNLAMETFSQGVDVQGLMVAIVTPLVLAAPSIGLIAIRHEQLRLANQKLQHLATYDWLTGCLNRGAFTTRVSTAIARPSTRMPALLVVDVDHFKAINDTHGHDRGDDALRLIGGALLQAAPEKALVGRVGGEEFAVFLESSDGANLARIAEQLRAAVGQLSFISDGAACSLSVSIGCAIVHSPTDFRTLYRIADDCLYKAKSAGRDQVMLIDAA